MTDSHALNGFYSGGGRAASCGLQGVRTVLALEDEGYPASLRLIPDPPKKLYVAGSVHALQEGIAIVGARAATPYGLGCAKRFSRIAAQRGIVIISGGARGCDGAAHKAAVEVGAQSVVFLGGGCDKLYPAEHRQLFQNIIDCGGAIVSEYEWDAPALPYRFRMRNRLIAGLARVTLIVEAGLPSGTFSTADEALAVNRDVLVVPGAITAETSRGANRLLYQGALPIVDDDSFEDALFSYFGCLKQEYGTSSGTSSSSQLHPLVEALQAEPLRSEQLLSIAQKHCESSEPYSWLMQQLVEGECAGLFARYPDGRWGPVVP